MVLFALFVGSLISGRGTAAPESAPLAILGQWESATGATMSPDNISFTAPFVLTSNMQFQSAFPRPWTTLDSAAYAASAFCPASSASASTSSTELTR